MCDRWGKSEKELKGHIKVYHGKRVKSCYFECNFGMEMLEPKISFLKVQNKHRLGLISFQNVRNAVLKDQLEMN